MQCTRRTRYLGRRVKLFTCNALVKQVGHQAATPASSEGKHAPLPAGYAMSSAPAISANVAERDDIQLQFEDGSGTSLSVYDNKLPVRPGHHLTAVCAGTGKASPFLYLFNHQTGRGCFHRDGMAHLRRCAPYSLLFVVLPALLLIASFMLPPVWRYDASLWVADHVVSVTPPGATRSVTVQSWNAAYSQHGSFQDAYAALHREGDVSADAMSFGVMAHDYANTAVIFALDAWLGGNWVEATCLVGIAFILFLLLYNIVMVGPSTLALRMKAKSLLRKHRKRSVQTD